MSTTALALMTRAFRRLAILEGEEALSAAEAVDGLDTLNEMMAGFGPRGIEYVHATLASGDVVNVPDEQTRNVMLLLCYELADEYGIQISQKLAQQIAQAESQLQAAYYVAKPALVDHALRNRRYGVFDIKSGG